MTLCSVLTCSFCSHKLIEEEGEEGDGNKSDDCICDNCGDDVIGKCDNCGGNLCLTHIQTHKVICLESGCKKPSRTKKTPIAVGSSGTDACTSI